ncbi:MAG: sugar ABC transporter permease [Clostridiales bacterium]|nr:sugar ABC transporter permease [Clostridiales bacterium]
MNNFSMKDVLRKNVMAIALFAIYVLFVLLAAFVKGTNMLDPSVVTSLIEQNAYVYILGAGMLMCMLTGGNIDLSVGSFVCFAGAVVGLFSVENDLLNKWFGVWEMKEVDGEMVQVLVKAADPLGTPTVLLIAIGIGLLYGALLGFLIAYVRIPPWIATLAGYLAFRGLGTQVLTKASQTNAISNFPNSLTGIFTGKLFETPWGELNIPCLCLGLVGAAVVVILNIVSRNNKVRKGYQADPMWFVIFKSAIIVAVIMFLTFEFAMDGGIPVVVLWILAVLIIYGIITEKTTIGRHFMTVGGNAEASRLSGINNKLIMFVAYLNMAILTVIAALVVTARTGAANAFAGQEFELDAIAACIVGGVSAYGGAGTIVGMVVGATLIGVINQGMSLVGVDQDWIKIAKGLVLLAAVVFEISSKAAREKASKMAMTAKKDKVSEVEEALDAASEALDEASSEFVEATKAEATDAE